MRSLKCKINQWNPQKQQSSSNSNRFINSLTSIAKSISNFLSNVVNHFKSNNVEPKTSLIIGVRLSQSKRSLSQAITTIENTDFQRLIKAKESFKEFSDKYRSKADLYQQKGESNSKYKSLANRANEVSERYQKLQESFENKLIKQYPQQYSNYIEQDSQKSLDIST